MNMNNGITVEVKDARDKDSAEPWSFFGAYESLAQFHELKELAEYCEAHPIIEIRILPR